jgi:serine/threonine-protein kinase RsbW
MARPVADVQVSIDSQFENIELVQVVVDDSLQRLSFDDDARYWIGIAVREAVANAIKHGNAMDPGKQVEVALRVREGDLVIEVCDQGCGFDPGRVKDPLEPANLLRPDGRGIFYMRRFMDAIDYNFRPEGGTIVTLRKRIGPTPVEDAAEEEERS